MSKFNYDLLVGIKYTITVKDSTVPGGKRQTNWEVVDHDSFENRLILQNHRSPKKIPLPYEDSVVLTLISLYNDQNQ